MVTEREGPRGCMPAHRAGVGRAHHRKIHRLRRKTPDPISKQLWQSIIDCKCGGRCKNCRDNFSAIGEALDRKCPACGGPCEVTIACPQHE